MTDVELYPLRFNPVYKNYLWGGYNIITKYRRSEPAGIYAESWEVSDRLDGMSVVRNGPLAGHTLREMVQRFGVGLLGTNVRGTVFPLLVKLIDASDKLSVQVHPGDEAAKQFGGVAKTEMWYVLDARPNASLYVGFKPGVTEAQLNDAIHTKHVKELLNRIPVAPGDALYVPGGRVHAIEAGCLIFEVQQNSNTTYRVYDWGRVGPDGKPRPLHIREALRVIQWDDTAAPKLEPMRLAVHGATEIWRLVSTPHFRVDRVIMADPCNCHGDGTTFNIFFVESGRLQMCSRAHTEMLEPGDVCLIPAALTECAVDPLETPTALLRITAP